MAVRVGFAPVVGCIILLVENFKAAIRPPGPKKTEDGNGN